MKNRAYLILDRICCTCWLTCREWPWHIATWPGRDRWGYLTHTIGSAAYTLESRILCARLMGWLSDHT